MKLVVRDELEIVELDDCVLDVDETVEETWLDEEFVADGGGGKKP